MTGSDTAMTGWRGKRVLVLSPTPTSPGNYGNRRRIRQVCSDIKDAGGEIVFVHYASEMEWRDILPADAQAEMRAMWDEYYLVPPTVWLHSDPVGSHHEIDDWWDPAIEALLCWLFERTKFDVFIVNYTWLSRALTLAPPNVLRVLDTHDRFAGRKEMLQSRGIAPEFFYLRDDAAEKVALERADVVWAIKEQEAAHFASFIDTPVITMPYMQGGAVLPRPDPDPEGVLRVGVIGAGNNINRINIEHFVTVFRDMAREYFAPVRLVIAGSICDHLDLREDNLVSLMGRVEEIEDFYGAVDLVCIPMEFSTGLKIKTGEALSLGLPVVSTAHGFEGYISDHRLHRLPDLAAVARAAVALSFEPARLAGLTNASQAVVSNTLATIREGLEATAQMVTAQLRGLFVIDGAMLDDKSVMAEAIIGMIEFLSHMGAIEVFVSTGTLVPGRALDRVMALTVRITVDPGVARSGSLAAGRVGLHIATLDRVLDQSRPMLAVLDTALTADQIAVARASETVWIARPGIMAVHSTHGVAQQLSDLAPALLMTSQKSPWIDAMAYSIGAQTIICPAFAKAVPRLGSRHLDRGYVRPDILILTENRAGRAALLKSVFADLGWSSLVIGTVSDPADVLDGEHPETGPQASALWMMQQLAAGGAAPVVAIDLTQASFSAMAMLEILNRFHVPVLRSDTMPVSEALHFMQPRRSAGFWGLIKDVRYYLGRYPEQFGIAPRQRQRIQQECATEAGWAAVWRFCKVLQSADDRAMYELGL